MKALTLAIIFSIVSIASLSHAKKTYKVGEVMACGKVYLAKPGGLAPNDKTRYIPKSVASTDKGTSSSNLHRRK